MAVLARMLLFLLAATTVGAAAVCAFWAVALSTGVTPS